MMFQHCCHVCLPVVMLHRTLHSCPSVLPSSTIFVTSSSLPVPHLSPYTTIYILAPTLSLFLIVYREAYSVCFCLIFRVHVPPKPCLMKYKQCWEEGTNGWRWDVVSPKQLSKAMQFFQCFIYFTEDRPRTDRGAEIETRCKQREKRRKKGNKVKGQGGK